MVNTDSWSGQSIEGASRFGQGIRAISCKQTRETTEIDQRGLEDGQPHRIPPSRLRGACHLIIEIERCGTGASALMVIHGNLRKWFRPASPLGRIVPPLLPEIATSKTLAKHFICASACLLDQETSRSIRPSMGR
jgi:hypothetical protein